MALFKIKKNKLWIWKAYCQTNGKLIYWECRQRDSQPLKIMLKRLERFNIVVYFADSFKAYAQLIPLSKLIQIKKGTKSIKCNNFRQKHWFDRFRRKTYIVLCPKQIVEITRSLFAPFTVNNNLYTLLSFFT